jgi:glycosyltransferase involved in cell wall biosynthesis
MSGRDASVLPHVAVIIPALNEEQAIGRVLQDIPRGSANQVIVVDNGSTDATAAVARSRGATVLCEAERGYGAACLAGLNALDPLTNVVVFLDADYSDYPEEMEALLAPIFANEADLMIGSRTRHGSANSALSRQQIWGNRLATTLIRWRFGHRFTDLGPFRAIRRDALEALGMKDRGYGWTVEMQVKAMRAGLRVTEVPVRYRPRIGQSKISGTLRGAVSAGVKILYTIAKYSIGSRSDCRPWAAGAPLMEPPAKP